MKKKSDTDSKTARAICDDIKANNASFVAVIAAIDGEKATLHVACSADAVSSGAHAGKIVGEIAAVTGGKGGGKPDGATAGVGDISKITEAISMAADIISKYIK